MDLIATANDINIKRRASDNIRDSRVPVTARPLSETRDFYSVVNEIYALVFNY